MNRRERRAQRAGGAGAATASTSAGARSTSRRAAAPRGRGRLALIVGVVALGLLIVGVAAVNSLSGAGSAAIAYAVGQPGVGAGAPEFSLPNATGGTFQLSAYRGQNVLLYFQEGLDCAPCWQQMDDLQGDLAKFRALGITEIAAISIDPLDAQRARAERDGITFAALSDPSLTVANEYGTLGYGMMMGSRPGHTFILVGPDGTIRWRADYGGAPNYTMFVPDDQLLAALRKALATAG